jgi:hypothetical protein
MLDIPLVRVANVPSADLAALHLLQRSLRWLACADPHGGD